MYGVKKSSRSHSSIRGKRSGFTLLEVMLAAVVMLFAMATSLTTLQYGLRSVDTARNTTIASQILQSSIELLRLQNWTQIVALQTAQLTATTPVNVDLTTTLLPSGVTPLNTTLTAVATRFACTRLIADLRTNIKLITVTVTWTGMDGRAHQLSMETRYGKDGLSDYLYAY